MLGECVIKKVTTKNKNMSFNYTSNKNSWMTSDIFKRMLLTWDSQLRKTRKKILLLVDNCFCHVDINDDLTHIQVAFLPSNTTSVLQPMDAGVVRNFNYYKKKLISNLLQFYEEHDNGIFKVSILDALNFSESGWKSVGDNTIKNCFTHVGFTKTVCEERKLKSVDTIMAQCFNNPLPLTSI